MGRKKLTTAEFITKAKSVHGDKYDYSLVQYKRSTGYVKIICPIHGVFKQTPSNHLSRFNCEKCGGRKKLTTAEFITKAKSVHGDKYDYSLVEYVNSHADVKIICPIHGVFKQTPSNHLAAKDCTKCGRGKLRNLFKLTTAEFITKAKSVHGDKYDYSLVQYVNQRIPVKIICPEHGIFKQAPGHHTRRTNACKDCVNPYTLWSKSLWVKSGKAKGSSFKLYLLEAIEDQGVFYKIGITYNTVNSRICKMPYDFKVVDKIVSFDGGHIWDLENQIKAKVKDKQYAPKIEFGGYTECFKLDSKIKKIAQIIAQA